MNLGTAQIIRADSRHLPLADNSVDLVVTSPPYFALRSYQDAGEHYDGQIGSEPTPAEFVDALLEVTAECVRVLKPSGSLWVNLGDTYRDKALLGIPWRYALACTGVREYPTDLAESLVWEVFSGTMSPDEALAAIDSFKVRPDLKLRAEIIWSKTDGLPQHVTDRARRTHEHWFHFSQGAECYADLDAVRQQYEGIPQRRGAPRIKDRQSEGRPVSEWNPVWDEPLAGEHPLGKTPGSVWPVATSKFIAPESLGVAHFAAFPVDFPERIIKGWSPVEVCADCGRGRRPVGRNEFTGGACACSAQCPACLGSGRTVTYDGHAGGTCTLCVGRGSRPLPPTTPAVVLDPFGGTGTTALVAKALGRHGISVDMSADYCRLAEWRTNDRDQLAKVLGVAKAEQEPEGTASLLDLLDGGAA